MSRLIDADKLKEVLEKEFWTYWRGIGACAVD